MIETEQLVEKISPIFKRYWLPIIFGLFGLILLGYGLIGLIASKTSSDIVLEKASDSTSESGSGFGKNNGKILVDIEGAVISPGVYELEKDARIKDLMVKAGGLSVSADRVWFARNVNLASKLSDGSKIYIPSEGENISSSSENSAGSNALGASTTGLININSASESQLDSLPGVGPVTASKIIQGRPYQSLEDLLSKKAVSSKVFSQIKDKISIY